jgi:hypothetical protein
MSREDFIDKLKTRLASTNIEIVKRDVIPFIKNEKELDIWSNDYFLKLADMLKYQ